MTVSSWSSGVWTTPPVGVRQNGEELLVECAEGSDFWQTTFYGFERDSGHGLLVPFDRGQACEVTFVADFTHQYDQAGLLVRQDERHWVKAGVELSDGIPQVGAVVTNEVSDWSCGAVPEWATSDVTVRASWIGDALLVRARSGDDPWRTVRLAPFAATGPVRAGLFCASPERAGLSVRFRRLALDAADTQLHLDD